MYIYIYSTYIYIYILFFKKYMSLRGSTHFPARFHGKNPSLKATAFTRSVPKPRDFPVRSPAGPQLFFAKPTSATFGRQASWSHGGFTTGMI